MAKSLDKLAKEIHELPDVEKLRLVDTIPTDLDKPDAEIDRVLAEEARKRWAAYKEGRFQPYLMNPLWPSIAARERTLSRSGPAGAR